MDNLTHSLVGALLGQMGLKRKTGLAMPTLIIAANIPDIDAVATLLNGHQHLAIRRGITHGPPAMVILPLLLWAAMLWFDNWQAMRGKRPEKRLPVHKGWLLALAYIGTLSHPLFDWFNVYGIRLLEPFSSQWFYGDTLFIIDVWIWAALIAGVWLSLRQERRGQGNCARPAWIGFAAIGAYIFANGLITGAAEAAATSKLVERYPRYMSMTDPTVVANPLPLLFWQREILWRDEYLRIYGQGYYSLPGNLTLSNDDSSLDLLDRFRASQHNVHVPSYAFLFWSRMPVVTERDGKLIVSDQRFFNPMVRGRFEVDLGMSESDIIKQEAKEFREDHDNLKRLSDEADARAKNN